MGYLGTFIAIVGSMLFIFAIFALAITPLAICPSTMQHPQTQLGDPIVELCKYITQK